MVMQFDARSRSMKIILRWRWALVAALLLILYFIDRGAFHSPVDPEVWWYAIVMCLVGYFGAQLKRIEDKLDAIAKDNEKTD
jgi:hypothetical protein